MNTERLSSLIESIVREFMAHPKDVQVSVIPMAGRTIVRLDVNPKEVGRAIGDNGAHFKALQKICLAFGVKNRQPIELIPMTEPEGDIVAEKYGKFKGRDDWRKKEIVALIDRTAKLVFREEDIAVVKCEDKPNFVSVVIVEVARAESHDVVVLMRKAFQDIFNAVGRANGRVLFVDVIAKKSSEANQPKSSDGRYAREIRR